MSAENILTKILLEIGIEKQTPQLSNTDFETNQIRNFMNIAGEDISRRTQWSRLFKTLAVAGGTSEIALPDDFFKIAQDDAVKVNKQKYTPLRAITSPQQWQMLKARPSRQGFYHLSGGKIMFSPVLGSGGAIVRYVSKNWVEGKDSITQNGDVILIPERLVVKGTVWRWRRQKGLQFEDILAEFEADLEMEIKADRGQN